MVHSFSTTDAQTMRLYDHGVKVIRKFYPVIGRESPEGE